MFKRPRTRPPTYLVYDAEIFEPGNGISFLCILAILMARDGRASIRLDTTVWRRAKARARSLAHSHGSSTLDKIRKIFEQIDRFGATKKWHFDRDRLITNTSVKIKGPFQDFQTIGYGEFLAKAEALETVIWAEAVHMLSEEREWTATQSREHLDGVKQRFGFRPVGS